MFSCKTMLDYGSYLIDKFTYYDVPADHANASNNRAIFYEVWDNVEHDLLEGFYTFEEAQEYAERTIIWNWMLNDCLPFEIQGERRKAVKSLLIWIINNIRWAAAQEGKQGIERFVQ